MISTHSGMSNAGEVMYEGLPQKRDFQDVSRLKHYTDSAEEQEKVRRVCR